MPSARSTPAIRYRIIPLDPQAHLFEVTLRIARPAAAGQSLSLPAWIPGSYLIRDFARHIVAIEASCGGRRVGLQKLDKHTWRAAPCPKPLEVRYRVYAWDLSVRDAHLDTTHGFFNGTSVFLRVHGQDDQPCSVRIERPPGARFKGWRVATSLPGAGAPEFGFGDYQAGNYDELIDHPVELGNFALASFDAGGIRHDIALTGRHDADFERLASDLRAICTTQSRFFEPRSHRAPMPRYLFLVTAVGEGYGGLEHRSSTALLCARNDLPHAGMNGIPASYRKFLGLASHEYFHSWNIKRIKPLAFAKYDLERENHTRLLWVFEGFTSYYDDLLLLRSGAIALEDYFTALGETIGVVLRAPGRKLQSVAESSFDAWSRFYRQDENSPNAIVSYYTKGALVALALDLTIRQRSADRHSLDDVIRHIWRRFGRDFADNQGGLDEDGLPAEVAAATGLDLRRQIRAWTQGTADLPLARLLAGAGVKLATSSATKGGARLGARLVMRPGGLEIATAYSAGPAESAGLAGGDLIIAADGLRVDAAALQTMLDRRRDGERLRLHVFRRDELIEAQVVLAAPPPSEIKLSLDEKAGAAVKRLRRRWLGTPRTRR